MRHVVLSGSFAQWREAARSLLNEHVAPSDVHWQHEQEAQGFFLATPNPTVATEVSAPVATVQRVPRAFLNIAESVACHAECTRWDTLYRVLFRLTHGEPSLMEVPTDPHVHRIAVMDKAVRRAVHKMHAFVRFRAVVAPAAAGTATSPRAETAYVAWFEPPHPVVERASPFFVRRFPSMNWSILTPSACAHWDGAELRFTPGVSREHAPSEDQLEELWRSYYAHIFNPARLCTATMQAEMPRQYWSNLPEARLIAQLTREAPARVTRMLAQVGRAPSAIPDELRSRVGEVTVPLRSRQSVAVHTVDVGELDTPGAWDAVHDPGVSAARQRCTDLPARAASAVSVEGVDVRVGTASWTDPTILQRGVFYPDDCNTPEMRLRYYASRFPLVEVDATYYAPPSRAAAAAWASRTPSHFVFDIKAFALMTGHATETKRLPDWLRRRLPRSKAGDARVAAADFSVSDMDELWRRFLDALEPLANARKLGPVLLQFPRWFTPSRENADVLRVARERLGSATAAVEFRNPQWVEGRMASRTFALLERLGMTYVIVDAPPGTGSSMPPIAAVTTPGLAMMRLHGRRTATWEATHRVVSERYRYLYDRKQQRETAARILSIASRLAPASQFPDMAFANQGVHVVYNNCHANYGTSNADEITALLIEFDLERAAPSQDAGADRG